MKLVYLFLVIVLIFCFVMYVPQYFVHYFFTSYHPDPETLIQTTLCESTFPDLFPFLQVQLTRFSCCYFLFFLSLRCMGKCSWLNPLKEKALSLEEDLKIHGLPSLKKRRMKFNIISLSCFLGEVGEADREVLGTSAWELKKEHAGMI